MAFSAAQGYASSSSFSPAAASSSQPQALSGPAAGVAATSGSGGAWAHVVWSDARLNSLLASAVPWLKPTLRAMRPHKPVDKIDTMRYLLLFLFGGVYLDADQVSTSGLDKGRAGRKFNRA